MIRPLARRYFVDGLLWKYFDQKVYLFYTAAGRPEGPTGNRRLTARFIRYSDQAKQIT